MDDVKTHENTAYVVLGIHRSGTSLCTNILNKLGVFLGQPEDLLPSNDSNKNGYFENKEIVSINDEIFRVFGGSWDHPPVLPKGWEDSAELSAVKERISRLISFLDSKGGPWGIKDPRLCLTISLWKKFLPNNTKYILMYRPAEESFSSFFKMHSYDRIINIQFPVLWVKSFLNILDSLEKNSVAVISYHNLIHASEAEIKKLCQIDETGFLSQQFTKNKNDILGVVHDDLYRNRESKFLKHDSGDLEVNNIFETLFRSAQNIFSKIVSLYEKDIINFNKTKKSLQHNNQELSQSIENLQKEKTLFQEMKDVLLLEIENLQKTVFQQQDTIAENIKSNQLVVGQLEVQRRDFLKNIEDLRSELSVKIDLLEVKNKELAELKEEAKLTLLKKENELILAKNEHAHSLSEEKDKFFSMEAKYQSMLEEKELHVDTLRKEHQQTLKKKDSIIKTHTNSLESQKRQLAKLDGQIDEIRILHEEKVNQIKIMESSKFWILRLRYMGVKWAIKNPLKFIKKYFWKKAPTYSQVSWAIKNPLKFIKKYSRLSVGRLVTYNPMFKGEIGKKDIAVVLHLYYDDLWEDIKERLEYIPYDYQLIVTLAKERKNKKIIKEVKRYKKDAKFYSFENRGFDVIPFLRVLKKLKKETKYILKIHTKKSHHSKGEVIKGWAQSLMDSVLPSRRGVDMILHNLEYTDTGMFGGSVILDDTQNYEKQIELIYEYTGEKETRFSWIAGTTFWVRAEILDCFDDAFIDYLEERQPEGYSTNGTIAHGLERYFGKRVYDAGKIISLYPQERYGRDYITTLPQKDNVASKKDIHVFFHICCVNNYKDIVQELSDNLFHSGLYAKAKKIHCVLVGEPDKKFIQWLGKFSKFEIVSTEKDLREVEYPTLMELQKFCSDNDAYVLYFHTKGVFYRSENSEWWRKRLTQKTIQEYGKCISFLNNGCHVVGCGWKEFPVNSKIGQIPYNPGTHSHFSGNFWWADSSYIKKLPSLAEVKKEQLQKHDVSTDNGFMWYRIACEMWLGMGDRIQVGLNGDVNREYGSVELPNPNKKPNMLFVSHDNSLTGAPKMLFEIARQAQEKFSDYNVVIVASDITKLNSKNSEGYNFADINDLLHSQQIEYIDRDSKQDIERLVSKYKPKMIYINTAVMQNWVKYAIDHNIPYVWHIHEKMSAMQGGLKRFGQEYVKKIDRRRVFSVSDAAASDLASFGFIDPFVVNPFIDTRLIDNNKNIPQPVPEGFDITKPFILSVGSFARSKGADVFLEAARSLPQLQFLWIGEVYEQDLNKNLPSNFHRINNTANPYYFMLVSAMVLLCSREESFSLVALEALYLNTPVVSFSEKIGSIEILDALGEVIEGEPNVQKLVSFLENYDFSKKRLTRMTSEFVKERYSKQFAFDRINVFIEDALSGGGDVPLYQKGIQTTERQDPLYQKIIHEGRDDKFRMMCFGLTNYLPDNIPLIDKHSKKKSLIIETQRHPHFEFLVKNTIQKLGDGWGHMFFCSKDNYSMVKEACDSISDQIEIIILDTEIRNRNDYNNLLLNSSFWSQIDCEKVLVYQSDTLLFRSFNDVFMPWDYIGPAWGHRREDGLIESNQKVEHVFDLKHPLYVGNGGLSLRSVSMMKEITGNEAIIEKYRHNKTFKGFDMTPEDAVFSIEAQKNDKYLVPPLEICNDFAFEYFLHENSFGCHQPYPFMPFYKIGLRERFLKGLVEARSLVGAAPKVSVITTVFNLIKADRVDWFNQCVESVYNQSYKNTEHIIVDGGSSDGTKEILEEYAKKGMIKYISQPDDGIYDAMNKGIKLAEGRYIAFLGSDDYYHNLDAIKLSVKSLTYNDADFSYAPALYVSEGEIDPIIGSHFLKPKITDIFTHMSVAHASVFIKKSLLVKKGLFDTSYKIAADYDLMLRTCLGNAKYTFVADPIVTIRHGGVSTFEEKDLVSKEIQDIHFTHYHKRVDISYAECGDIWSASVRRIPEKLAEKLRKHVLYFDYQTYVQHPAPLKLKIVSSKKDKGDALLLQKTLTSYSLRSEIVESIGEDSQQCLYFLMTDKCPDTLPKNCILWLTKDVSNKEYSKPFEKVMSVVCTSQECIKNLHKRGLSYKKTFLVAKNNMYQFNVGRILLNFDLINFDTFYNVSSSFIKLDKNLIVLSLPETTERRRHVEKLLNHELKKYSVNCFDGVRRASGANGQGMGVQYLIKKAKEDSLPYVLISEDDIKLKSDTKKRLDVVLEYINLPQNKDSWDLVSGFTTEFNDDYNIHNIFTYKGVTFMEVDKIMSSVFVIYNNTVYDKIISRDAYDTSRENYMDQFLKRSPLRVLLVFPFLIDHHQDFRSTIWGGRDSEFRLNSDAFDLEKKALDYLSEKVGE